MAFPYFVILSFFLYIFLNYSIASFDVSYPVAQPGLAGRGSSQFWVTFPLRPDPACAFFGGEEKRCCETANAKRETSILHLLLLFLLFFFLLLLFFYCLCTFLCDHAASGPIIFRRILRLSSEKQIEPGLANIGFLGFIFFRFFKVF